MATFICEFHCWNDARAAQRELKALGAPAQTITLESRLRFTSKDTGRAYGPKDSSWDRVVIVRLLICADDSLQPDIETIVLRHGGSVRQSQLVMNVAIRPADARR